MERTIRITHVLAAHGMRGEELGEGAYLWLRLLLLIAAVHEHIVFPACMAKNSGRGKGGEVSGYAISVC